MSEQFTLDTPELTPENIRSQIQNYSREHSNDFGVPDGRDRIPMKKLMKLFGIKKKTPPETQNLFRQYVNDFCDLENKDPSLGKVLVLKETIYDETSEGSDDYGDGGDDEPDYGYGEDTVAPLLARSESDGKLINTNAREERFKLPPHTASGGLSVATAESVGVYDDSNRGIRRTGYRRRGSVTRYSIVGQNEVKAEYTKHEDVISQFRRDSLKIEHCIRQNSLRNLQLGNESNHSGSKHAEEPEAQLGNESNHSGSKQKAEGPEVQLGNESNHSLPKPPEEPEDVMPSPSLTKRKVGKELKSSKVNSVRKLWSRKRFSLAF